MNKTFIGILLAVCLLGMALALFSERLSRQPETPRSPQVAAADTQLPNLAASNGGVTESAPVIEESPASSALPTDPNPVAEALEKAENEAAKAALSPPEPAQVPPARETVPQIPAESQPVVEKPAVPPVATPAPEAAKPAPVAVPPEPALAPAPAKPEANPAPPAAVTKPEEKPAPAPADTKPEAKPAPKPEAAPAARAETKQPTQPKSGAADRGGQINNFVVFARDKGATIRLGGSSKIKYSHMTLENPNRVVVDLDGTWKFPDRLPIPKNDMVSGIRVGKNGDKTRVVIDLKAKPRLSRMVEGQNGNSLDVRVDK